MGQYDALFEAEPQVQSKYDALFEKEPTPTPVGKRDYATPATIRSEGQGPEPREDPVLARMRESLFARPEPGMESVPPMLARPPLMEPQIAGGMRLADQYVPSEDVPATEAILESQKNLDFLNRNLLFPSSPEFARMAKEAKAQLAEDSPYAPGGPSDEELEAKYEKEHPYIHGIGKALEGLIPQSWEQAKEMLKLPQSGDPAQQFAESEELGKGWRGEYGPSAQAASITGTALQALPLLHLPFAESPLRPKLTDLDLVGRIKAKQAEQLRAAVKGPEPAMPAETARVAPAAEAAVAPVKQYGYASPEVQSWWEKAAQLQADYNAAAKGSPERKAARKAFDDHWDTVQGTGNKYHRIDTETGATESPLEVNLSENSPNLGSDLQWKPSNEEIRTGVKPEKITTREEGEISATQEGQVEGGVPVERAGDDTRGAPAETGVSGGVRTEAAVPGGGGAPEAEAAVAPPEPAPTAPVPPEAPAVPPEDLPYTGVSKVAIAEQRGARGVPDIERQKQLDFGQSVEHAKATLADNPLAGEQLIENFMEKARPIATEEVPLAIEQLQRVQREFDAAAEAVNKATPEELPYAQDRLNNARAQYDLTTEAVQNATSATGAGLNSVKMLLKDDFSLARMEQVARAVINDGKPLSPKQTADVAKLHKRLQVAETKIAGYEAQDAFRAALKEAKAEQKAGFRVTDFMDRQAQAARERIVARRGKLYADPLGVTNVAHLADEAIIGASHITRGVTRFADWSSAMLREFGENIKPYLRGLYAKAKELAGNTAKGKLTPEEREARALGGEKKRIRTLTEKMRERLVKRDVSPLRQKREPRMDEEKVALLYEREKVKKDYREMLAVETLKRAPWYKKAGRLVSEPLRAVRSLKFSFDASALMQQGGFETFGHPIAQAKRVMPMLRAMKSEVGQFKVMNEIQNMPEWKSGEFRQAGVEFGDIDTPILAKREEIFASRLAQKVPGVKMSERGFVTLLNQIRAERYRALKNDLFGGGLFRKKGVELTLNEKKILGNFVNVSTGRGNLGPFKQATMLLNAIFAAPRLRVSNFQLLLQQPLWHKLGSGSGRVRWVIFKELARTYAGIAAAVTAASQIPGVDVELDSHSTDFGQIRMGNLRINPFSRLTSPAVLTRRLTSGKTKTQKGEIKPIYGEVPYGGTTGIDVAGRYLRGGLTPVIGGIVSGMTREMVTGEPTTPLKELTSAPLPLSANNLSDALKAEGVPAKIISGILSTTGMGVGYYGPRSGAAKKAEAARLSARDKALLHGDVRQAYELSFRPPEEEGESVAGGDDDISRRMRMRAVRPSVR